jgi:hypothetical protein
VVTAKRTRALALMLLVGALALIALSQIARATHPRPSGATPVRVSLVPAYKQCTAPNTQHGPPLAFPSCKPAILESNYVTVGTGDSNGASANSNGFELIRVVPHTCCPPQDVVIKATITDVRCQPGTAAQVCGPSNSRDGPDYTGQLQGDARIRITDHNNGPDVNEPATVVDIPFPVSFQCASTSATSIGGTCSVTNSAVAVVPQASTPARAVVEMTQLEVFDGGQDGMSSTTGNTVFMRQGVFIP